MTSPADGRFVLYGHDTVGLGHLRRNLKLATTLTGYAPGAEVIILTGSPAAASIPVPSRIRLIAMPPVGKSSNGEYESRVPGLALKDVIGLRRKLLARTLAEAKPRMLIVDHAPTGVADELWPVLEDTFSQRQTITVLGLRDIIDHPARVRSAWQRTRLTQVLSRYHDIWVYGEKSLFDPVAAYALPTTVASKVSYLGYLGHPPLVTGETAAAVPPAPYLVVSAGGGEDGQELFHTFRQAWDEVRATTPLRAVLIPGPFLPGQAASALEHWAGRESARVTVAYCAAGILPYLYGARLLVAMGGYNTLTEAMVAGVPVVALPRTHPRLEQHLRVTLLANHGPVSLIEPGPAAADQMAAAIRRAWHDPPPRWRIEPGGLSRVLDRVDYWLTHHDKRGDTWHSPEAVSPALLPKARPLDA